MPPSPAAAGLLELSAAGSLASAAAAANNNSGHLSAASALAKDGARESGNFKEEKRTPSIGKPVTSIIYMFAPTPRPRC